VKPGQETALTVQQITEATQPRGGAPQFRNALNNAAFETTLYPNETVTSKVLDFHKTGNNPYKGDADAVAGGRVLYDQWCASCHLSDATGRIGPNLVDNQFVHPRVATDVGTFEIIYAGGAGAMQSFGNRLTQEEILKIMAFLDSIKKR
jgi:cytochrome c-L